MYTFEEEGDWFEIYSPDSVLICQVWSLSEVEALLSHLNRNQE